MFSELAQYRAWAMMVAAALMLPAATMAQQEDRAGQQDRAEQRNAQSSQQDATSQQRDAQSQDRSASETEMETKTGKLVDLHEHMTGGDQQESSQARAGQEQDRPGLLGRDRARQARGMSSGDTIYALVVDDEVIVLGQLNQAAARSGGDEAQGQDRPGVAGQQDRESSDRSAFRRDRDRGQAGQQQRGQADQQQRGQADRQQRGQADRQGDADSLREDIRQQRDQAGRQGRLGSQADRRGARANVQSMLGSVVRIEGKLHDKAGVKYMAVSSIQSESGSEAGTDQQSGQDSQRNRERGSDSRSNEDSSNRSGLNLGDDENR